MSEKIEPALSVIAKRLSETTPNTYATCLAIVVDAGGDERLARVSLDSGFAPSTIRRIAGIDRG